MATGAERIGELVIDMLHGQAHAGRELQQCLSTCMNVSLRAVEVTFHLDSDRTTQLTIEVRA